MAALNLTPISHLFNKLENTSLIDKRKQHKKTIVLSGKDQRTQTCSDHLYSYSKTRRTVGCPICPKEWVYNHALSYFCLSKGTDSITEQNNSPISQHFRSTQACKSSFHFSFHFVNLENGSFGSHGPVKSTLNLLLWGIPQTPGPASRLSHGSHRDLQMYRAHDPWENIIESIQV